jgi:hypothetical protein
VEKIFFFWSQVFFKKFLKIIFINEVGEEFVNGAGYKRLDEKKKIF